jgi:L-seryl-tRNA(Ser) seleniumtransferase
MFQACGAASASGFLGGVPAAAATPAKDTGANIYAKVGVRPFINMTGSFTINGGMLTWPEVKEAMDQASYRSVNIEELMEKVGARIAQLLQCEAAIVTSGCAGALTHATAACVAGADPEKFHQLPNTDGLKNEVIMPRQSRNMYDFAIRAVGVKIISVNTIDDFHAALGRRTAMVAVNASSESRGIRLEELAKAARPAGVPILVDAAAHLPSLPNQWLLRGADLVGFSGGKSFKGPQCAGLLIGRKDLIQAAWINSAPHHTFGRAMKVGKEEIMGMLAAVEVWSRRDLAVEHRTYGSWNAHISERINRIPGVKASERPPDGPNPYPTLTIEWDPSRIGITAGEVGRMLLDGEPRIASHAQGDGHSFQVRPASMRPGDDKLVADRLYEIFSAAKPSSHSVGQPVTQLAGRWDVEVRYVVGDSKHTFFLETASNRVRGTHLGAKLRGDLEGTIDGDRVRFRSRHPYEGSALSYEFTGQVDGNSMSGELTVGIGEYTHDYGLARWTAQRHV